MDTKKLRQKILDLAIHGKLVPQDPNDEPASVLLERIRAEKERLIAEGKIKRSKKSATSDTPHYENVPFEVPDGWCWTTIGEVSSSILYGVSESAKEAGAYKLLRITDIQDNKVNWDSVPYTDFDKDKAVNYLLQDGDILFARTGATVGKSYLVSGLKEESIYASYLIRVQTSQLIFPEYIKRFFESGYYWEQISLSSVGIGQPNVNGTTLANLNVPIPPYIEQLRIVEETNRWLAIADILDENTSHVCKAIESARAKILDLAIHGKLVPQDANDEPASELLKRINPKAVSSCDNPQYVNRMFEKMNMNYELPVGWCWCRLEELFQFIRNGKNIKQIKGAKGYPITRIETISNSIIDRDRMGYANITQIDGFEDYILRNGDILMSHINSPIHVGKSALCCNISKGEVILHGMNLLCLRPHPGVDSFYLDLYFKSSLFRNLIRPYIKNAVNQASINTKNVGQTCIPFPPKAEQKRLVNKVTELYSLLLQIELSLQA